MGRKPPATSGPPSREAQYRHEYYLARRLMDTGDTSKSEVFFELMNILYQEEESLKTQRKSWLHSLAFSAPSERFKTYESEIYPLIRLLKGEAEPKLVEDIGCGTKTIAKLFAKRYPKATLRTMNLTRVSSPT